MGEKCTGANPTDRAKCGTKRSMVVDGSNPQQVLGPQPFPEFKAVIDKELGA